MADGFIRWYRESAATPVFDEQVALFEARGLALVHPAGGQAVVLNVEGDGIPIRQEDLGRLLALRIASITMNWWFTADTNVVGEYSYEPLGCEIQTLWLDGVSADEARRVEAAVVTFAMRLPVPTRAVIVDRDGVSDPDDWDSLVLYDGADVGRFPDSVLAQAQIAEKILRATPSLTRQYVRGGLTRLSRANGA
ncbi:hypothetical protein ACWGLE_15230 [Streptomyces sp. NPDC055897]